MNEVGGGMLFYIRGLEDRCMDIWTETQLSEGHSLAHTWGEAPLDKEAGACMSLEVKWKWEGWDGAWKQQTS